MQIRQFTKSVNERGKRDKSAPRSRHSHSMFFDPRFHSYSALKICRYSGQLAYETWETNFHTILMSKAKVVQTKLYRSFIFLINEAVDQ